VRIDAPIGAEKPIPEIVDYRKIAIGIPVVEKMELLLSPEPGKLSMLIRLTPKNTRFSGNRRFAGSLDARPVFAAGSRMLP